MNQLNTEGGRLAAGNYSMPQTLTQIGKYRVERELGRGGMGVVYKAFDPVVERTVAIKTIRLDVENVEDLVTRLKREAKSVGQLEHPNIVTLYDAGEAEGLFYLAMQFIKGETLEDRITRQRWFTLRETYELFQQICAGLGHAHQHGVIHRDIKPANIMITHEGVVKLTDFGIAKLADARTSTSGLIVGTPSYMSPEQALGKLLDGRSDIFSLGSILYELITGEKAFPGQNATTVIYKIVHEAPTPVTALQPGLDPALEAMVLKALAKRAGDRFQTCGELANAIEVYLNEAVASVPKTAVESVPQLPSSVATAPPPPAPTPTPSAPLTPSPSTGVPVATPAPPSAGTQAAPIPARVPLAWLGGGALGTLLLVILILLVVQLRNPVTVVTSPSTTPPSSASQTTPSGSSATPTQTPVTQTTATPPSEQPASASATPPRPAPTAPQRTPTETSKVSAAKRGAGQPVPSPKREAAPQMSRSSLERALTKAATPTPALPAAPETFESLIVKGDLAFQQAKYQDALNAYSRAYRLNPRSPEARRKIALALTLLGRADEARKYQ